MPDLDYSRVIIIRVSHPDPIQLGRITQGMQEELAKVLPTWSDALPDPKPKIDTFAVGREDFPMREVS